MSRKFRQDTLFVSPKKRSSVPLIMLILLLLVLTIGGVYNILLNSHVLTENVSITVPNLPSRLEGYRILVMSDLHGQFFGPDQAYLKSAVEGQNYNIIIVNGDLCDRRGSPRALIRLMNQLPENTTTLFIPGDEDPAPIVTDAHVTAGCKADYVRQLEDAGAVFLDAPYAVTVGASVIWFCPESVYTLDLDSLERAAQRRLEELAKEAWSAQTESYREAAEYQLDRCRRIREAQKVMKAGDIHIAVAHVPLTESSLRDLRDLAAESIYMDGISLVIAGHYNAGQWRLPGAGAVFLPESFPLRATGFFPSDTGLVGTQSVNGITQFISSGLGAYKAYPAPISAFRLFNEPRISVIRLTKTLQK